MNRKRVAALAALLVAVAGVFGLYHYKHEPSPITVVAHRDAKVDPWVAATKSTDAPGAPRGRAPKWTLDVDPEGPLRLEGQVVDADGRGVGGAEVWLGSVPPRTAKTEGDGSFG